MTYVTIVWCGDVEVDKKKSVDMASWRLHWSQSDNYNID